jgi:hypothetical protein
LAGQGRGSTSVLAHAVGDKVEEAYRRGNMLAKRHALMADWEAFCGQAKPA